jgi:predicted O-linked N-acetylglucosamine transferase (SPINDLY family)
MVITQAAPSQRKAAGQQQRFLEARRKAYRFAVESAWPQVDRLFSELSTDERFNSQDWLVLATARYKLAKIEAACLAALRALALEPDNYKAAHIATMTLVQQNRWREALPIFESHATGPARENYDFLVNHGATLAHLLRPQEAVSVYLEAMALEIADPAIHMRLGIVLKDMKLFHESAESFLTAQTLDPNRFAARLMVLHMRQFACQWDGFEASRAGILEAMVQLDRDKNQRGEGAVWALTAIEHPPALFKSATAVVAGKHLAGGATPLPRNPVPKAGERRIRVGYISGDFHNHATTLLMVEALEHRNREAFEVTLYSHSLNDGSDMERRVRSACERFVDMNAMSEQQMARAIHADGIDILVDLKGHTFGNRLGVFARRPAPIQATWLGFPGTSGADYIDYFIGDPRVTPIEHADHYSERIAQMPHSYQPNDGQRFRPQTALTRAQCGLPEGVPVLACFNQSFKIGPDNFAAWMRIMQAVPESLLWILEDNAQATQNLQREAVAAGVDAARLRFAPRAPLQVHLARLPLADLMLDNWPCNAHTTASDALWMGVPIVTLTGEIFASRVCGSLLHAVGLDELACSSVQQYEDTAIALLRDPERLRGLRRHLDEGRGGFPLFDGKRFAADLERLYERMVERERLGLAPDHLPALSDLPGQGHP